MINQNTYVEKHSSITDKIILSNRKKIIKIIYDFLKDKNLFNVLDIGSTSDENESSNIIIKSLSFFKEFNSISNQKISNDFFKKTLQKSITENLLDSEIEKFKSDVVISNATIEHVGSDEKQLKMCQNIIKLSKRYFIIITPNRLHPLEFHTKIPLIHWLPKNS